MVRKGLGTIGKEALKTGAQVLGDVLQGESFGDAAKRRVGEKIKQYASDEVPQSGSGWRRRRVKRKRRSAKKRLTRKRAKTSGDIFGE